MGLADPKICIHRRFLCLCVDRSVQRAGSARGELGARDAHGARHILPCLGNGIYRACGGAFRTRLLPQCKDAARRAVFVQRVYDRHDLHLRTLHARALSVPGAPAPAHGVSFGTGSSHPSLLRRVYGVDPAQCAGGDVYRGSPERARQPVQRGHAGRRGAGAAGVPVSGVCHVPDPDPQPDRPAGENAKTESGGEQRAPHDSPGRTGRVQAALYEAGSCSPWRACIRVRRCGAHKPRNTERTGNILADGNARRNGDGSVRRRARGFGILGLLQHRRSGNEPQRNDAAAGGRF